MFFVLPSRTEAFPYVPLEAGLAQLPVVANGLAVYLKSLPIEKWTSGQPW